MSEDEKVKKAQQIYIDPTQGYWGLSKMRQKYRKILDNVYTLQRHKERKARDKRKLFRHIEAKAPFHSVQMDLADLPKLKGPLNQNVRYLLVVIDVFSRYLWIRTLTSRKSLDKEIESVLLEMKRDFGTMPKNITGDNEYATTDNQRLAAKYDFKWWFSDAHEKFRTGIAERVIRTIKNLIKRYNTQNETTRYTDVLPMLVQNYNNTEHRIIRTTPYKAISTGKNYIRQEQKHIPEVDKGESVRVEKYRDRVKTKGDVPYFSKEVYEVMGRDRNRYILKNKQNNQTIRKRYARHQLLPIDEKKVFKGKYAQNVKKNVVPVGYDEQIKENERIIRNKSALKRKGIDLDRIVDKNEREAAKDATIRNKYIEKEKLEKKQQQVENKLEDKQYDKLRYLKNQIAMYKRSPATRGRNHILARKQKELENLKKQMQKKPIQQVRQLNLEPLKNKLRRSARLRNKPRVNYAEQMQSVGKKRKKRRKK